MAIDLNALSNATTMATALANLMLVTPNKNTGYQPTSINGQWVGDAILFNYEGEQSASMESDITDHFIENNSSINDHISLKPETITTQGFIGELSDITPGVIGELKRLAQEKLIIMSAYTPAISTAALLAINQAQLIYDVGNNVVSSVNALSSINQSTTILESSTEAQSFINSNGLTQTNANQTKQQVAFQAFYGYWRDRTLFTVQTPWAIFENMAIKTMRASQDAETRMITDFEITFKMMRFASTKKTDPNANRNAMQSADATKSTSQTGPDTVLNLSKIKGI